jgi:alpha-mannosidase
MCDCKYGADKPDDGTVRLTLLHTPGTHGGYEDQATQDLGRHHVLYALSGHAGDWRAGKSAQEAARLNQPLIPFRAGAHEGELGKSFSLFQTSSDDLRIQAIKKAEGSEAIVVRLRELSGHPLKGARLSAAVPIASAHEVDGQEREIGKATLKDGAIVCDVGGFELRAFALELGSQKVMRFDMASVALPLAFDRDVVSTNQNRAEGFLPAEELPSSIHAGDVTFELGRGDDGQKNALACNGQELALPQGEFDRLYLLAASDEPGGRVQSWTGMLGQWDRRIWRGEQAALEGIEPGFIRPAEVAWFASHHHTPQGDAFYEYSYLYKIPIELPKGAKSVQLPKDEHILVLAASASQPAPRIEPAAPLFDTLDDHVQDAPRVVPASGSFKDVVEVALEPGLFWRDGRIRYTLDGTPPSASSPTYAGPFVLDHKVTITAAVLDERGALGPVVSASLAVDDVTPPSVLRARPAYESPLVRIDFSEPVSDTALQTANYKLEPRIELRSAKRGEGTRQVLLEFASAPKIGQAYKLQVGGVADASPAHNTLKSAAVELKVNGPVFERAEVTKEQMGSAVKDVPNLPVKAGDSWTINFFARTDKQPEDRTILAGFGRCEQTEDGAARYIVKFPRGIQFWAHNRDVAGRVQLDLNRWQMLSASYDGTKLRLYRDGKQLAEREISLTDDENAVHFAPPDPWDHTRRFEGELRGFTIWGEALGEDALRSLLAAAPR